MSYCRSAQNRAWFRFTFDGGAVPMDVFLTTSLYFCRVYGSSSSSYCLCERNDFQLVNTGCSYVVRARNRISPEGSGEAEWTVTQRGITSSEKDSTRSGWALFLPSLNWFVLREAQILLNAYWTATVSNSPQCPSNSFHFNHASK